MCSIDVKNVHKSYGTRDDKQVILNGLNMTVAPSSIFTLIGASGCGKTTLLSCILGMMAVDSGSVRVLGQPVTHKKPSKVGHLIGFMPQNTALVPELTILETLSFFGNIFLMSKKMLKERTRVVMELLELPTDDRQIQNLSGGQKRRVSLAAAILHNPVILILDEPTVGLDSILREKIWAFLIKTTRESKMSIVITTHYISEAHHSDRCGMMRDGILLAEDSPKNILSKYDAENLDEAFLNLCLLKAKVPDELKCIASKETVSNEDIDNAPMTEHNSLPLFERRNKFSVQTIAALYKKEYIRLKRQEAEIFFILILPIIQILGLAYAVGGLPYGLKLGIVNGEVTQSPMCDDYSHQAGSFLNPDGDCVFNYASCLFLNEIRDRDIVTVNYDSYEEAYWDAKKGKLMGVVTINRNMSNILTAIFKNDEQLTSKTYIDISLDQSDLQLTSFLQLGIYRAYEKFRQKLMRNCSMNERMFSAPMDFSETIHGSLESDFKATILPASIIQAIMFSALGFSCFAIAQNRIEGIWNRTLLAGVRPLELLVTQVIVCVIVMSISLSEMAVTAYLTLSIPVRGSMLLLMTLLFVTCMAGSILGISLSVLLDDLNGIAVIMATFIQCLSFISGNFWPLEAQPIWLKYLSMSFPVTMPSLAVRNIVIRGHGIEDPTVQYAFLICVIWITISLFFAYLAIKKRRFSV